MLYLLQTQLHQPENMSAESFNQAWAEQSKAAMGAVEKGVIKNIWKVAGERSFLVIADVPDHDTLDRVVSALPFNKTMGSGFEVKITPLREYMPFAEELMAATK